MKKNKALRQEGLILIVILEKRICRIYFSSSLDEITFDMRLYVFASAALIQKSRSVSLETFSTGRPVFCGDEFIDLDAELLELGCVYFNFGRDSLDAGQRLMNQIMAVREAETSLFRGSEKDDRTSACNEAHTDHINRSLDETDHVENRITCIGASPPGESM